MGSPGEEQDSFAPVGGLLNLRLGGDGSQAPLPPLAPTMHNIVSGADGDVEINPALNTGMSTASMYGNDAKTSDGLGSKVSLWDLRCDVKTLVDCAKGPSVLVPVEMLQLLRTVMREHVRHRKVQRGLAQQAKVRHEMASAGNLHSCRAGAACEC
jgi:hypothetical protein